MLKLNSWPARSFLTILVTSLAACSTEEPQMPAALTPQQAGAEYRSEARTLTLAPGWSWPAHPISATAPDGAGMVYEPGYGKQAADYFWYCSWTNRTLASERPAARNKALKRLLRIRKTYYYNSALAEDSKPFFDQMLESAALGDMSGLQRDYALNCPTGPPR